MKLATYYTDTNPARRLGLIMRGRVFDMGSEGGPSDLKGTLDDWENARQKLLRISDFLSSEAGNQRGIPEENVSYAPPIVTPGKFICVGKNYPKHIDELVNAGLIQEIPNEPTGFIKLNSTLVGHDAAVKRPEDIAELDYEPELVVVISKPGYRITKKNAMDHVAGITVFNDLTAREIQRREVISGTRFWTAKNMPGFGPIGPYLVTPDEVEDVNNLWLTCTVNGELRSRFNTSGQINKIPGIIEHFSRYIPVEPGDMFATGSAGGMAAAQSNAVDLFLKPGDVVEVAIESVLALRTHII
jgi:2-keto-4-pentenoate hydratase/2-oxohepta-3-ene-1,7-dioic acid hydratase in catechol pathway